MKLSLNWLREWVELDGVSVDEIVTKLTLAGIEVAGITSLSDDRIVVGRIEVIEAHPKSDKLVVCKVDVGDGQARTIVCGAKNMVAGDVVPVALDGARPVGVDFEIVTRPVAGVVSEGMLCAEEELGLSHHSDGLWILPKNLKIGQPAYEATGTQDQVIEVELTPNRSDCLSHKGIARELSALLQRPMRRPEHSAELSAGAAVSTFTGLRVEDAEGCPRYGLAVVDALEIGPSPDWLRHRLAMCGTRSINNVVDMTNYVLLDVGQPLHAFDLDKLQGEIVVRRARAGESMVGIDHKSYTLDERDLVIADSEGPVAIAGVMGGERTEVTESTRRIAIECAQFHPSLVRKTAKRLGVHTESSHRFERGIDSGEVGNNLRLAVRILASALENSSAILADGVLSHETAPLTPVEVRFAVERVNQILGTSLEDLEVVEILNRLGIETVCDEAHLISKVPTWRPDIERPIDLIEEVARVYGYDKLTPTLPRIPMGQIHQTRTQPGHPPTIIPRRRLAHVRRARTLLLGAGFAEAMNYSFFGDDELAALGLGSEDVRSQARVVANPLAADQRLMRTSLVPGLLKALRLNVARKQSTVAMFEFGRVYLAEGETERLAVLATGSRLGNIADLRVWDFYDLKGLLETLVEPFALSGSWVLPSNPEPYLHPGVQAEWQVGGKTVAVLGQLHPRLTQDLNIETPVFLLDVNFEMVTRSAEQAHKYAPMPKFPAVHRDFAFLVDEQCRYGDVEAAIRSASEMMETVQLFDVYSGPQVPAGKRSVAVAVSYRAADRTLTEEEINAVDSRIISAVQAQTGATLR